MTSFDILVFAIIAVSVAVSVVRGAAREVLSIASWILSGYLALRFAPALAEQLPAAISSPTIRLVIGFVAIMLAGLLVLGLLALGLTKVLKKSGLSATDRLLGAVVGFVRAIVILEVLTLLAGLTPLPREASWRNAMTREPLETLAIFLRGYLPAALESRIRYD
jgi:membrane protein required for colicin V production